MFLNYYICLDSIGKCDAPLIYTNSCPLLDKVHRGWREKEEEEKKKKILKFVFEDSYRNCLWKHGTRVKGIMKMASASFLFCRDECRRIERSSFGKNNCILLFRRREQDRLKQRRKWRGSEIEENGKNGNFIFDETNNCLYFNRCNIYYTLN